MAPAIPLVFAGVSAFTWWRLKRANHGKMTEERKKVFEQALKTLKDPTKLEHLAQGFDKSGLKAEGTELRKRAKYYAAPKEVKDQYKDTFRKALTSTKPQAVANVAKAFNKVGLYGAAEKLRTYGSKLDAPMGPSGMPPVAMGTKPAKPKPKPNPAVTSAISAMLAKGK